MRMEAAGMEARRAACAGNGQALTSLHGLMMRIHEEGVAALVFIRSSTACMSACLIA